MEFPYGKAPLVILLLAVATGLGIAMASMGAAAEKPTLVMAIFAKDHAPAYRPVIEKFEKEHGIKVQLQVVEQRALDSRLQSALQVGAEVPDMVELLDGTMGVFTAGPLADVGLVDLTERVERDHLRDKVVASRFIKWSSRGHVFALPHDVHPVMLAYRKDLTDQLGIDVSKLTTWEEFCRVGREVVKRDDNHDGVPDHYMLDMDPNGSDNLRFLLLQAGESLLSDKGDVAFDTEGTAKVVEWFVRQNYGPGRIAAYANWGQTLAQHVVDGVILFYFCPDWRTRQFENDIAPVAGKMAVMPLPAWTPGGLRTSTWGGTGLAITKACKHPDLAWELAMRLYYNPAELGQRYRGTAILPPLKAAWSDPAFAEPRPYYGGQQVGLELIKLANDVPAEQVNAFTKTANEKLSSAYVKSGIYYQEHGETGFHDYVMEQLWQAAADVRTRMARNPFLHPQGEQASGQTTPSEKGGAQ